MISCIYVIENLVNHKKYIGSTVDFKPRISKHMYLLRNNKHENQFLQNSFNKYGEDKFHSYVLKEIKEDNRDILNSLLLIEEEKLMFQYDTLNRNKGYNIELPTRNMLSEYTKNKISATLTGTKWDEERYKNLNNAYSKKLQLKDAILIRQLKEKGVKKSVICNLYDISERTYYYVISNRYHKEYN